MHIALPTTLNRMIISRPEAKTGVCLTKEQMLRKSVRTVASITNDITTGTFEPHA